MKGLLLDELREALDIAAITRSNEPIREVLEKIDSERFEISRIKSLGEDTYEVTGTVSRAPRIDGEYVLILTKLPPELDSES